MNKKAAIILFLVVATELIGFGLIIPILPQIAVDLNITSMLLGVLLGSYSFAQFIGAPILGALSDKYGRKPVLVVSKLGSVVSYGILAYATSFHVFLIARLLDGFTGGNIATARAYIADITTEENRSKGMAIIGIAFGVGFVLGPAIGGLIFQFGNQQTFPALIAGLFSFIALLLTIILLPEPHIRRPTTSVMVQLKNLPKLLKTPALAQVLILQLVFMVIFSGFETTFSIFTDHTFSFSKAQNSQIFAYIGVLMLIIQGYLSRKREAKPNKWIYVGGTLAGISFLGLALAPNVIWLLCTLVVLAVGVGLFFTYTPAYFSTLLPPESQGEGMGVFESIGSFSRFIGPMVAATLIFVHMRGTYILFAGCLIAATVLWKLNTRRAANE